LFARNLFFHSQRGNMLAENVAGYHQTETPS